MLRSALTSHFHFLKCFFLVSNSAFGLKGHEIKSLLTDCLYHLIQFVAAF